MPMINKELNEVMGEAVEELKTYDLRPLMSNLSQRILDCYELEEKAFLALNDVI